MRFLVEVHVPTEAGNKMMRDPDAVKNLENYLDNLKPEAAYFGEEEGERRMYFVVDLPTADMMASIAEPLYQAFNARVKFHPVMTRDELKKAALRLSEFLL